MCDEVHERYAAGYARQEAELEAQSRNDGRPANGWSFDCPRCGSRLTYNNNASFSKRLGGGWEVTHYNCCDIAIGVGPSFRVTNVRSL